ncbi:hypothetical protein HDR59_03320 [bacterium]|nr:hypothetical protein [bacterium]
MKKLNYILAIPITMFILNNNVRASDLINALSEYCVPPTSEYCTGPYAATYDTQTKTCKCKNTTYLRYNSTDRHCEINCPAGYVPSVVDSCGPGTISFLVAE